MYFDKTYILTRAVKNPSHDKRVRYNSAKIAELSAGTIIYASVPPSDREVCNWVSYYDVNGNPLAYAHEPFGKAITEAIEETNPRDWEQIWVKNFGSIYPHHLRDTISELVKLGTVTIPQIIRAAKHVDDKYQENALK